MTPALRRACARAVHVVTPEGRVLRAGRATMYVLAELGWRRTAALLATPPLVWAVEAGYALVAANRGRLSGLLPPERPAPPTRYVSTP
jgi:predicted DCC family thiol-disulfide oxidoreductase YuxK